MIVIKDMDKPETCASCPLRVERREHTAYLNFCHVGMKMIDPHEVKSLKAPPKWCPIYEVQEIS